MDKIRMVVTGCWHLADNPPGRRVDGYSDHIFAKIEEVIDICNKSNVDVLVVTGDIFHVKAATRNSHRMVNRLIKLLSSVSSKIALCPGNHDISSGNIDTLEKQPLGVVISALKDKIWAGSHKFDFVPGIAEYVGQDCAENFNCIPITAPIVVAHVPISPNKEIYPHIYANDVEGKCKLVLYGHIHAQHGIYKVNDTVFINPGALSRGSIAEDDMERKPSVALVDYFPESGEVKAGLIPLKNVLPVSEIFKIEEYNEEKRKEVDVENFVSALESVSFSSLSSEGVVSLIKAMDIDDNVREAALYVIERMEN